MKANEDFREIQPMKQWWVWGILLIVNASTIYGCYRQLALGKPFGNNPISDPALIGITVFVLLVTVALLMVRLDTYVDKTGFYVRFLPFQRKYKYFDRKAVAHLEIRKYKPIVEYGGWGYRTRLGKSTAYNMYGNRGLQLTFIDGKKVLIGTQKPEELKAVLDVINKLNDVK